MPYETVVPPITPYRRMMIFVDGENIAQRFETLVEAGRTPRADTFHRSKALAWHPSYTHLATIGHHDVIRATIYASLVGSDDDRRKLHRELRQLTFANNQVGRLPNNLAAEVFARDKKTQRSKGVDIKLTVDALAHGTAGNFDTALILTGDGDFVPLVEQLQRAGKQVYIAAFSSGFSERLQAMADAVHVLDGTAFDPV